MVPGWAPTWAREGPKMATWGPKGCHEPGKGVPDLGAVWRFGGVVIRAGSNSGDNNTNLPPYPPKKHPTAPKYEGSWCRDGAHFGPRMATRSPKVPTTSATVRPKCGSKKAVPVYLLRRLSAKRSESAAAVPQLERRVQLAVHSPKLRYSLGEAG